MVKDFLIKNRYIMVIATFVIWMLFFDKNNWWDIMRLKNTYRQTKEERNYYKNQAEIAKSESTALFTHPDSLEKFAREKYLMKKDNEDVFVIVPADED